MANLEVLDGQGVSKYLKGQGVGTDLDPFVPEQDIKLLAEGGDSIGPQNPLPVDGDDVYEKDLDTANSTSVDFTGGLVADLFNSLTTVLTNATANNPKTLLVYFNRFVSATGLGITDNSGTGTHKGVKIEGLRGGSTWETFNDNSASTTPFESRFYSFTAQSGPETLGVLSFNALRITFNTADSVSVSALVIGKIHEMVAYGAGTKPSGVVGYIGITESGAQKVSDQSDGLAIVQGDVDGQGSINKFGNAPDFDTSDGEVDIWDGADDANEDLMDYTYSTAADIDRVSSSSASDIGDLEVQGLDANYDMVTQTVSLTGQTPVALTTSLIRVFRMTNRSNTDLVGRAYCFVNGAVTGGVPDTLADVRAIIGANGVSNNQTEMAIFTIPAGKTGYIREIYASTAGGSKDTNYVIKLKIRPFGEVFQLKHRRSINDNKDLEKKFDTPEVVTEKSDVIMTAFTTEATVTGSSLSAGFDIVLKDN